MIKNEELKIVELKDPESVLEYRESIFDLLGEIDNQTLLESIKKLLKLEHKFLGVVQNQEKIGFLEYHMSINLQKHSYLIIDELEVIAHKRSQGIGSKILEHIIAMAKSKDSYQVGLLVLDNNFQAQRFYKKHGFKPRSKWYVKSV